MSKKVLVRFDVSRPEKQSSDFLAVYRDGGTKKLRSLKNGKESEYGITVFTGRSVGSNDLFAKIVDSGQKVASVDLLLEDLQSYIDSVKGFKVG